MAKLMKRKHLTHVEGEIFILRELLNGHGARLVEIRRELERQPLSPEVERLEALLGGVKVALERMGGSVLPSFQAEVSALKGEMGQFSAALFGYQLGLDQLLKHLALLAPVAKGCAEPEVPQRSTQGKERKTRKYTRKPKPEVEILSQGTAPHNEIDEEEPLKH